MIEIDHVKLARQREMNVPCQWVLGIATSSTLAELSSKRKSDGGSRQEVGHGNV